MSAVPAKTQDPSMEEILASIRRIIADDGDAPRDRPEHANDPARDRAGDPDDVLDLADQPEARMSPPVSHHPAAPAASPSGSSEGDAYAVPAAPAAAIPQPPVPEPEPDVPDLSFVESPPAAAQVAAIPAAEPAPPARQPEPAPTAAPAPGLDGLISTATTASVSQAFNILSHTILTQNARTLEDLVRDMLKPMLKVWLDDNLPPLVERLVRAEIERVARGNR